MAVSLDIRRSVVRFCLSAAWRSGTRAAAMLGVFALLLLPFRLASAQAQDGVVVTNHTGRAMEYKFRANYNDGNGSDRRYFAVAHEDGKTLALTAAEVTSYGILIRLPDGSARKLWTQWGPYQIRTAEHPSVTRCSSMCWTPKGSAYR